MFCTEKKSFKHTPNLILEEVFTEKKLLRQWEVEVKQWLTVLFVFKLISM